MAASSQVRPSSKVRVSIAFVIAALGSTAAIARSGYLFFDWRTRDVTADWVMTRAAFSGDDPYGDLEQLGPRYKVPYRLVTQIGSPKTEPAVAFRPPGAFLPLVPLLLSNAARVYHASLFANVVLLLGLAMITSRIAGIRMEYALLSVPLLLMTKPVMGSIEWGTQSIFVAVLIAGAWLAARSDAERTAGSVLAVAATLKLFPLLLVVPLIAHGKRRAAWWAGGGFVALQAVSIAVFRGINVSTLLEHARASARFWGPARTNGSLASVFSNLGIDWSIAFALGTATALCVGMFMWRRTRSFDARFAGTIVVAILISPLAWIHYDAALFPAAAWGVRRGLMSRAGVSFWAIGSLFGWLLLTWLPGSDTAGYVYALARLGLLGGFIAAPVTELTTLSHHDLAG